MTRATILQLCSCPSNIQFSKIDFFWKIQKTTFRIPTPDFCLLTSLFLVGLDRLELSTSPLSGVRSSHLSYRPGSLKPLRAENRPTRSAALTAGQSRSHMLLSSWWSWSGSNRRPPECKSGALPTELQPLIRYPPACSRMAARKEL
jgi:hypothetical protein